MVIIGQSNQITYQASLNFWFSRRQIQISFKICCFCGSRSQKTNVGGIPNEVEENCYHLGFEIANIFPPSYKLCIELLIILMNIKRNKLFETSSPLDSFQAIEFKSPAKLKNLVENPQRFKSYFAEVSPQKESPSSPRYRLSLEKPLGFKYQLIKCKSQKEFPRQGKTVSKAKTPYQIKTNIPVPVQQFFFVTKGKKKVLEYMKKKQIPSDNLFEYLISSYSLLLFRTSKKLLLKQPAILREYVRISKIYPMLSLILKSDKMWDWINNKVIPKFEDENFIQFMQVYRQGMRGIYQEFKIFIKSQQNKNQVKIKNQVLLILACCSRINQIFTIPVRDRSFSTNYLAWRYLRFNSAEGNKQFHEDFFEWLEITSPQSIFQASSKLEYYIRK